MVVVVGGCGREARGAEVAEEGGAAPVVGLALLVPRHLGAGGVDGQLVVPEAAPVDGDLIAVEGPMRVRRILLADEVIEAVGVELNLPTPNYQQLVQDETNHAKKTSKDP